MTIDFTPDALFFDMDGTLLDTERVGSVAFAEITRGFGIAENEAVAIYASLVGTSSASTRARVVELIEGVDIDTFISDWHAAVARNMAEGVPLKPTVSETLSALTDRGMRMLVVTSTGGARARGHLEVAGLLHHFETVIGGDEVSANKPDPAPYLEAAGRLGVDPGRTIAFEDSDHGVASAITAGCVTVQIPDIRPAGSPLPALGQRISANLASAIHGLGLLSQ
ncbi:MAG: HAD family phosphatase [Silicimonas sp.]